MVILLLALGLVAVAAGDCSDLDGVEPPLCAGEATPCEDLGLIDCFAMDGCSSDGLFDECTGTPSSSCGERGYGVDCAMLEGCQNYLVLPCELDQYRDCPRCQSTDSASPTPAPAERLAAPAPLEPSATEESAGAGGGGDPAPAGCADLDNEPPFCAGEATPCEELGSIDCLATDGCSSDGIFGECTGTPSSSCRDREYGVDCAMLKGCQNYLALPCDLDLYRDCPRCQSTDSVPPTPVPAAQLAAPAPLSPPTEGAPGDDGGPAPVQSAPPAFAKASPTNFCYDHEGCYGRAKDCGELDITACGVTEGCSMDESFGGIAAALTNGVQCLGTTTHTCRDRQYGPRCEMLAGCKSDYDPPCERDPFDIAITPLDAKTVICGAKSTPDSQQGGCTKTRPSRDGEVTVYMQVTVGKEGSYSGCVMTISGQDCQSCDICGSRLEASFDCANVLSLDRVEGDDRCAEKGMRCVGRTCTGECICGNAGAGNSSVRAEGSGGSPLKANIGAWMHTIHYVIILIIWGIF